MCKNQSLKKEIKINTSKDYLGALRTIDCYNHHNEELTTEDIKYLSDLNKAIIAYESEYMNLI